MFRTSLLLPALLLGPCLATADEQQSSQSRVVVPGRHILDELNEKTDFQFVDVPLRDAFAFLSERHRVPFVVDEVALKAADLPLDLPLNRELNGVSLRAALDSLLEPLGLVHVVREEYVVITSFAADARRRSTRVYDVRHLVNDEVTIESLAEAIEQIGGESGRITPVGRTLVVTQRDHDHTQTERLLAVLAKTLGEPVE